MQANAAVPLDGVTALLLDMDGLMVDSEPVWHAVERALATSRGGVWTDEMALACVGTGLAYTVNVINRGLRTPLPIEEGVTRLVDGVVERIGDLRLKPGCRALVDAAHGKMSLVVASSSPLRLITAVVGRFALLERFDALVSGESVPHPKPAPDIFLAAAARIGRAPAGCVVLEDSIPGVLAARAAGMRVIAVPEHEPARFLAHTQLVVSDLHAARDLLGLSSPQS